MIAALSELHNDIHEAGSITRFGNLEYEGSVIFIYRFTISLSNWCKSNLQDCLLLSRKRILHILFHFSHNIRSKDCVQVTYLL